MKFVRCTFDDTFFAVGDDDFQKTYVCDIYDRNGQRISHDDSGSAIILWSDKAVKLMNSLDTQLGGEEWSKGDYVYAYDYHELFWDFIENTNYVEGVDYIFDCEQVEALTVHYPDKSVSVVINCPEVQSDFEWASDHWSEYFRLVLKNYEAIGSDKFNVVEANNGEWWQYKFTKK